MAQRNYQKDTHNITFSSDIRNIKNYPDTNSFMVHLPNSIKNVIGVSLQCMEMNLSTQIIEEGYNDVLQFSEGLKVGRGDSASTKFVIYRNTNIVVAWAQLPSYLNPIKSYTQTPLEGTSFTCAAGHGFWDEQYIMSHKHFLIGFYRDGDVTKNTVIPLDHHEFTINVLNGLGEKTITIGGGQILHLAHEYAYIHTVPLSNKDILDTINNQLKKNLNGDAIIQLEIDDASGKYKLYSNSSYITGTYTLSLNGNGENNAMTQLGFSHNQRFTQVSSTRLECIATEEIKFKYTCKIPSGNYSVGTLATAVTRQMNKGALNPQAMLSTLPSKHDNGYYGAMAVSTHKATSSDVVRVPSNLWFRSPINLQRYINNRLNFHAIVSGASVSLIYNEETDIFTFGSNHKFSLNFAPSYLNSAYTFRYNDTNMSSDLSDKLCSMLGFDRLNYSSCEYDQTLKFYTISGQPSNWPKYKRTWRWKRWLLPASTGSGTFDSTDSSLVGFSSEYEYPSRSYAIQSFTSSPNRLTMYTNPVDLVNAYTNSSTQALVVPHVINISGFTITENKMVMTSYLAMGDVITAERPSDTHKMSGIVFTIPDISISTTAATIVLDNTNHVDTFPLTASTSLHSTTTDNLFSIYDTNVLNTINYRLGVAHDYLNASFYTFEQQFDVSKNHYFLVTVRNLNMNRKSNNTFVIAENRNRITGEISTTTRDILARCVVSAPFVFDRGQMNSISFSMPQDISTMMIEFFDEDGLRLLRTNKQEISFTFSFTVIS